MKRSTSASCLVALAALASASPARAADTPAAATASIRIEGDAQAKLDFTKPDGGLLPVRGVQSFEVMRASRARPDLAEGKGYYYNHHVDLAVWQGRYYVAWDSGEKDEDIWPAHQLYATSTDGANWSAPIEFFPQGLSTSLRFYFYRAANGRMLLLAGRRVSQAKLEERKKGGLLGREIRADHTLGPVHLLRPAPEGALPDDPPSFDRAADAGFAEACRQFLADRIAPRTQDYDVLLEPANRMIWLDPAKWPRNQLPSGFIRALTFYRQPDNTLVMFAKNGYTSVSRDDGATWAQPVVPPSLVTGGAKVWSQRTGDGRYALVYNPHGRLRFPLVLVHGDDGATFRDMRAVESHFNGLRFPGINKSVGLQYTRGIATWADDGSIPDTKRAMWLVYSANKEDIWVSRVPLPVGADASPAWNLRQPKWGRVATTGASAVALETREPWEAADATQLFAPTAKLTATLNVSAAQAGRGALDIELLGGAGAPRPVRVRLMADGKITARSGAASIDLGTYAPNVARTLVIAADCAAQKFTVSVDGRKVADAEFAEKTDTLHRFGLRAWARPASDVPPLLTPPPAGVAAELDQPAESVSYRITGLKLDARP